MPKPQIDPQTYPVDVYDLLVLHRPKDTKTLPNGLVKEMGKAPIMKDWTAIKVDSRGALRKSARDGNNVGVRLKQTQVVIDVDPRNGGDNGYLNLCADLGLDFDKFPRVITGSNGFHVYARLPPGVLVRDTLEEDDYAGVEFKSLGRQVVAAGSVHPNGNYYRVDTNFPADFANPPMLPRRLLSVITRPARSVAAGGGELTPLKLAELLEGLDPCDYDSNDKWFPLMAASHHATAGEGRHEFVEWSTQDADYAKYAFDIGKRWDSLHAEKNTGFTLRTLNRELRGKGAGAKQAVPKMADDEFPDDVEEDETPGEDLSPAPAAKKAKPGPKLKETFDEFEASSDEGDEDGFDTPAVMQEMLDKYYAIIDSSKFRILFQELDPEEGRDRWTYIDPQAFQLLHGNKRLEVDKTDKPGNGRNTIKLGQAWLEHPRRRDIKAVVFDPMSAVGEKDGYLNLFQGWAYAPSAKGTWDNFREMMFEVIAAGDDAVDAWVMNWLAHMFQRPNILPQSAIVMTGDQGIGKGTFGNTLCQLIGKHAHALGGGHRLTGRFNAHLRNLIFLFADEVTNPYNDHKGSDTSASNTLKNLITEPRIEIERKYADTVPVKNLLHLVMATNDKWVIPAATNERRYLVTNVSDKWRGNTSKWDKLHAELRNGGFNRMLFDFMNHEIPAGYRTSVIVETEGLSAQKTMTFGPIAKFIHQWLDAKSGVTVMARAGKDWSNNPFTVLQDDFLASYEIWCRTMRINPYSSGRYVRSEFFREVQGCFKTVDSNHRKRIPVDRAGEEFTTSGDGFTRAIMFPSLTESIEQFEQTMRLTEGTIPRPDAARTGEFG